MKIKLLITGGTIDKSYNMHNGELHFVDSHIPAMLNEGRCKAIVELDKLMLKDSLDMTENDRLQIVSSCQQSEPSKIIITHGTDTMVQTAQFLDDQVKDKTIVLTGAMIPYVFDKSDSLFNLGTAFSAVQFLKAGVYIAMNGQVFKARNVVKNREEGVFETLM
ncbi:MAG: asparaginase [Gammaproteobacteria bacterium]|nr:asparaginase [Gammaproteobacteria bacterium]